MPNNTRPSWDDYFLEIAQVVSKRSTCRRRHYGAVIVKDNIIVSTGYNGAARGLPNCDEEKACYREAHNIPSGERYEACRGVHAEANAIINGDPVKMRGATIYIAGYNADGSVADGQPCLMCRRMILNAQIERLVWLEGDDGDVLMEIEGDNLRGWIKNEEID